MPRGSRRPGVTKSRTPIGSILLGRVVLAIGPESTVVLLRLTAAAAVIAATAIVATVMFRLPSVIDIGMAVCLAGGWTLWLTRQERP